MNESLRLIKKAIQVLFVFVLLYSCSSEVPQKSIEDQKSVNSNQELEKPRLKRMISTSYLTEHFGTDSSTFEERIILSYDTAGKLTDRKQYILDSTVLYKHQYHFQEGDTLIEVIKDINNVYRPNLEYDTIKYLNDLVIERRFISSYRYHHTPNGSEKKFPILTKILYQYDTSGILISTRTFHDGKERLCTYAYDVNHNLSTQTCIELPDHSVFYEKWHVFNQGEQKIKQAETFHTDDSNGNPRKYVEEYFYNRKGLKVKQTETSFTDDSISGQYVRYYKYNEQDSMSYQSWYRNGKNFAIYNYTYDQQGNLLSEQIYNDGNGDSTFLAMQTHYYYNSENQLKFISILGHHREPMRSTYFFYDKEGNKVEERRYTHTIDIDKQKYLTRLVTKYQYEFYE